MEASSGIPPSTSLTPSIGVIRSRGGDTLVAEAKFSEP
jgi:hypothetical protein